MFESKSDAEDDQDMLNIHSERLRTENVNRRCQHEERDDTLHLEECTARFGDLEDEVKWIQCDGCNGWKCYGHIHTQYEVNLYEYEEKQINEIYYVCNLCLCLLLKLLKCKNNF